MNLVIVESPAKAKTIKSFLGKEYEVVASKGHIRDLPKSTFGIKIDEENGTFEPTYRIAKENKKLVDDLKARAKKAKTVYIATDEDREGEAIGYHVAKALGLDPMALPRIVFHEITKSAITHSIKNPRSMNMNQVDAQQTRRLLDRIVGFKLSPLLSQKIQSGLSGGRVQSSTLKIIVDREREIQVFIPMTYYKIWGNFKGVTGEVVAFEGKKFPKLLTNLSIANQTLSSAAQGGFKVKSLETKQRKVNPQAPFMTSTLQASASSKLGFNPKKTMTIAQKLYEGVSIEGQISGLITYMRTDSLNLAKEAIASARDFIAQNFDNVYLPNKAQVYASKSKGAQEAHEAIRPAMIELTPKKAQQFLNKNEFKLYELIYNRFLACQMTQAVFENQTVIASNGKVDFKLSGRKMLFDGFYKVYDAGEKDKILPDFTANETLEIIKPKLEKKQTEPPSRYSEAGLIKQMESEGIGRPSTYSPTISTLQSRNYVEIEKRSIKPTPTAFTVVKMLEQYFENIVQADFTANMEEKLDQIALKGNNWNKVLWDFYEPFIKRILGGKEKIPSQKVAIKTGEKCPSCGEGELIIRKGRFGEFQGCSNYPKCKYTTQISKEGEEAPKVNEKCKKCGKDMVIKEGRGGPFMACSGYPDCKNAKPLTNDGQNAVKKTQEVFSITCPKCGKEVVKRFSRRGPFFGCSGYPKCTFTSANVSEKVCEKCGNHMSERKLKTKEVYDCLNEECKHKVEIKIAKA